MGPNSGKSIRLNLIEMYLPIGQPPGQDCACAKYEVDPSNQLTQDVELILVQFSPSVVDDGPTLSQHWLDVFISWVGGLYIIIMHIHSPFL